MRQGRVAARQTLERKFRETIDRDVSVLAVEYCQSEGLDTAAILCQASNEHISNGLWSRFAFDWVNVTPNPSGTMNRASQFIEAKLELTVVWAVARGAKTAEVSNAEDVALVRLQKLWNEWAGYMVTTSEVYEMAMRVEN